MILQSTKWKSIFVAQKNLRKTIKGLEIGRLCCSIETEHSKIKTESHSHRWEEDKNQLFTRV